MAGSARIVYTLPMTHQEDTEVEGYDIIGDVHGYAGKLEELLRRLGYAEQRGAWRHPARRALFVGDLIDRGPEQLRTVGIVRRMVEAGSALAVMGNHEFNALAFWLPDPHLPGESLRPRTGPKGAKNRRQHEAFLAAVEHDPGLYAEIMGWFLTLPLWLELPALRVVHACWHPAHMERIRSRLLPGHRLDAALIEAASRKGRDEYDSVETIAKGVEAALPPGAEFHDKDGHHRRDTRLRWWDPAATTFGSAAILPAGALLAPHAHAHPVPPDLLPGYPDDKPVFFGHYWMTGTPTVLSERAACVDYSAGLGGPLVAYRFDREPRLSDQRFVMVM